MAGCLSGLDWLTPKVLADIDSPADDAFYRQSEGLDDLGPGVKGGL